MISFRRFREWLSVVFGPRVGVRDWVSIIKGIWGVLRSPVERSEWIRRTRICMECPIYDTKRKTCRPFKNSVLGCGCYIPYSNLVKQHCWGRETYGEKFGW